MASLSQAKLLGGIGSILIFIPFVSLVGYILLLVAVKNVSDIVQDRKIFNNIIIAAVTGIVGAFAGGLVIVVGLGSTIGRGGSVLDIGAGLLVVWIFLIISAVFLRRTYDTMSEKLGVGTFRTAATLYLIGAVLTIIVIGFLVLLVAEIVQAIAFFSIPDQAPAKGNGPAAAPTAATVSAPSAPPTGPASKFCTSCGTKISPTATFCYSCGAKQQ